MRTYYTLFFCFVIGFFTLSYGQNHERYKHLADTVINSTKLKYQKKIRIIVPREYQKDLKFNFPLIIVFDIHLERMQGYTLHTIDYLTSTLSMPPSIIIQVQSGEGMNRRHETDFKVSHAEAFGLENEQFIFKELIPYAEEELNTSNFRILIGHSRYGYFSTYLLTNHLTDLNAVISMSPFFLQKKVNLVDSLVAKLPSTQLPNHVYYRFGIGADYPEDFELMDEAINSGRLQNPKFHPQGVLYKEAFHNATPGLIIAESLYDIFEYWAKNQNAYFPYGKDNIDMLAQLQDSIYDHYGAYLPFSMTALNGKGWEFYGDKKYAKAIKIWKVALEQYPNLAEFHLYIAAAQKEMNEPYGETLAAFLNLLESSEAYSDEEKAELLQEFKNLKKD